MPGGAMSRNHAGLRAGVAKIFCGGKKLFVTIRALSPDVKSGSRPQASGLSTTWVYILKTKSGGYYVGSTLDLPSRLKHHLGGHTPSTKRLIPEALLLGHEYATLAEARSIERKIKKLKHRDYIERMIKDGYIRVEP